MTNFLKLNEQLVTTYVNHDAQGFKDAIGGIFEKIRSVDWLKLLAMAQDALDKLEAIAKLLGGGTVQTLAVTDIDMPFVTTSVDEMLGSKGGITLDADKRAKLIELFTTILMLFLRSRGLFPTLAMERTGKSDAEEMEETPTPSIPTDAGEREAQSVGSEDVGNVESVLGDAVKEPDSAGDAG